MKRRIPEPAVKRSTLLITAGIVWALVGIFLSVRAIIWIVAYPSQVVFLATLAIVIGLLKSHFVFSKIIKKNIERIKNISPDKEKICIFAFQAMQSYFIILVMIPLGIYLRMSSIPRNILVVIYLAIGSALFKASMEYFKAFRQI
ncbi:MAG: hypothetical protein GXO93_01935 [FCB group bacterium]|nr:hypothetical protein [FCB group bacterium]